MKKPTDEFDLGKAIVTIYICYILLATLRIMNAAP